MSREYTEPPICEWCAKPGRLRYSREMDRWLCIDKCFARVVDTNNRMRQAELDMRHRRQGKKS